MTPTWAGLPGDEPRYADVVATIGRDGFDRELTTFREWQRTVHAVRRAEAAAEAAQSLVAGER